jgi:hypothetical protein
VFVFDPEVLVWGGVSFRPPPHSLLLWWLVAWWLRDLDIRGGRFIRMTLFVVMRWCCGGVEMLTCWI